jgi:cell division protein FtsW
MATAARPRTALRLVRDAGATIVAPERRRWRRGGGAASQPPLEHRMLVTATLCLLAAGAVMVYSASSPQGVLGGNGAGTAYLVRFCLYGAAGLVAMHVLSRHGLELVHRLTPALLLASLAGLLVVLVPHIGIEANGARRWIGASSLQFQPSELAKLALVLHAAKVLAERRRAPRRARELGPILLPAAVACLLVAVQPDLGTAMTIGLTLACVLVAAGVPLRTLAVLAAAVGVAVLLFAIVEPYSRSRLTVFLDPWAHAGSTGFQAVQGQIALGSGGLFGRGLGQSVEKVYYLPEAHTDFILAVIGEELGVAGVAGLLCLYGMIAFAGLRVARGATGAYAKLLSAGVTSLILCQALLNVFAVLGLAPLTGVPLPFISYGSNNLIVLLAAMGLLLNVAAGGSVAARARPRGTIRRSERPDAGSDRGRRDGRARSAGAGRRRRATG